MEECGMLPKYKYGSGKDGKVMIVEFPTEGEEFALRKEKDKMESLFKKMGYTNIWDSEKKNMNKENFFKKIEEAASGLQETETFAIVIICPQKEGKLRMSSGESFDMENIYLKFKAETAPAMKCKPKLCIFHTHPYQKRKTKTPQKVFPSGVSVRPFPQQKLPVTVPSEGYMLVIYSYEDYIQEDVSRSESVFVSALTEVLEEDLEKTKGHKDILELMVDVSSKVLQKDANNQIPIVLSTLNSHFYLNKDL